MMKYKLLTIGVASLLPLGFAATASATGPTASHEVTFTVADARSISVEVLGDPDVPGVLDLGTVGTDEYWDPSDGVDHVRVTFRATDANDTNNKVAVTVQLRENNEGELAPVTPQGVDIIANIKDLSSALGAGAERGGTPYVDNTVQNLWSGLYKEGGIGETTFNVRYGLDTRPEGTVPGDRNYFIVYSLTTDSAG